MPTDTFQSRRVGSSAQARRRIQHDAIDSSVLTRITRIFLACTVNDSTPFYSHRLGSNLTQFYLSYYFVDLIAQKRLAYSRRQKSSSRKWNLLWCPSDFHSLLLLFSFHIDDINNASSLLNLILCSPTIHVTKKIQTIIQICKFGDGQTVSLVYSKLKKNVP